MSTLSRTAVVLGLLLGVRLMPLWAEGTVPVLTFHRFECPEGYFRCEVPAEWSEIRDERDEARTHCYGTYLFPADEPEVRPALSIDYYAPDNPYFATADKFIHRQLNPSIKISGDKTSPPRKTTIDGRAAQALTLELAEFYPPETMDAEEIPIRREYVVIPHRTGFVLVTFSSPIKIYERWRPVLDRCLKTLELWPRSDSLAVRVTAPGVAPEDIEHRVAEPMEKILKKATRSTSVCSISRTGEARIWADLMTGENVNDFQKRLEERLKSSPDLPTGARVTCSPEVGEEVFLIGLWSRDIERPQIDSIGELSALARRMLVEKVQNIPGVARIEPVSRLSEQIQVIPDLDRLGPVACTISDIQEALGLFCKQEHSPESLLADLRETVCTTRNGQAIRLTDLAEVRLGAVGGSINQLWMHDQATGKPVSPPAVVFAVRTWANVDPAAVFRSIEQLLKELEVDLPPGVQFKQHASTSADLLIVIPCLADASPVGITSVQRADKLAAEVNRLSGDLTVWRKNPESLGCSDEFYVDLGAKRREDLVELRQQISMLAEVDMTVQDMPLPFAPHKPFPGMIGNFTLTVSGADLQTTSAIAEAIAKRSMDLPGVRQVNRSPVAPGRVLQFQIQEDNAQRFGLKRSVIEDRLASLVDPVPVGVVTLPRGRQGDLVLALAPDDAQDPSRLANVSWRTPAGDIVRLSELATIIETIRPEVIFRKDGKHMVVVALNTMPKEQGELEAGLQRMIQSIELPRGYTVSLESATK